MHVIGLGSAVETESLQRLATAGGGVYLQNPDSSDIDVVFDRVTRELTTLQTQGRDRAAAAGRIRFRAASTIGQVKLSRSRFPSLRGTKPPECCRSDHISTTYILGVFYFAF